MNKMNKTCLNLCWKIISLTRNEAVSQTVLTQSSKLFLPSITQVRTYNLRKIYHLQQDPGKVRTLRARVHWPKDGIYTVDPLEQTKLGGRDPETGRIVHGALGGGEKWKHYWVDFFREGPTKKGEFLYEKIIDIIDDPNRTSHIALVNGRERLRYILATTSMKIGQVIASSSYISRIPVLPIEGNSYPVGALPLGTKICCVSLKPGGPGVMAINAGLTATLRNKVGENYVLQMPDKRLYILDPRCMCVVGQISNPEHGSIPIGSPNRLRDLGWRSRSGLWQRKTGYHGRKIRPLPPPIPYKEPAVPPKVVTLNIRSEQPTYKVIQCVKRIT